MNLRIQPSRRAAPRLARRLLAGSLLFVLVGPFVGQASAHATLIASSPANDEVVAALPSSISMTFDEAVSVDRNSVSVFDPSGKRVDVGSAALSKGSKQLKVRVDDGGIGSYTVSYAVLSADGHVITGAYTFHVKERTGAVPVNVSSRTAGATFGALGRWIALMGSFVAGGVLWTALFVTGRGAIGRLALAQRLLMPAAAVTLFGSGIALLGRAAELSGRSIDGAFTEVPSLVVGSRTGTVAGLRVLVALVLLIAVAGAPLLRRAPWLAAIGILATLALPSFGGHASTASPAAAAVLLDVVHVLAASAWLGGLAVLVLAWADEGPPTLRIRAEGFSRMALPAAALTIVSGVARGWWTTQSWDALTQTSSGKLILAKAAGATVMLGFGWVHRRWLADRAKDVTGFLVSMRTEMLIGAAVLAVTAVLVNTRPAVDTVLQPVSTVATVGGVTVQMEVTPARTGPNEVHLYFLDAKGLPSAIDAAELKVSSASVEPRRVPLTTITASHSTASGIQLTPGLWDFDLTLVRSGKLSTTTIEVAIK